MRRHHARVQFWLGVLVALVGPLVSGDARADADIMDRIAVLNKSISTTQSDSAVAALLLSRAELHRFSLEWQMSLDDIDAAARLNPNLEDLELQRGLTLLRSGRAHEAVVALKKHLASHPDDGFAWVQLGRAHADLQLFADASNAYARAIQLSDRPAPELFLEAADAIQARGPEYRSAALRSIDAGIATIGPAISLELRALELERRLGQFDDALNRLSGIIRNVHSKAPWLLRKGEVLLLAGRKEEARRVLEEAMNFASSAPPTRRRTTNNLELIKSIEHLLTTARE